MTRLVTGPAGPGGSGGSGGSAGPGVPVQVRRRDDAPEQFLWAGRLYLVQAVLARWTEAGGWWRALAATPTGPPAEAGPLLLDDGEQEWWRVEAGSGRSGAGSGGTGVYDLCFTWSSGTWSLVRVQD